MQSSRRDFLGATSLAAASVATRPLLGQTTGSENAKASSPGMPEITIAGYQYDRVEALIDGRVKVESCETKFVEATIGDMNTHVLNGPRKREVTEIGLSPYMLAYATKDFAITC